MTAREIKEIDKEISWLCSKRARLEASATGVSPKLTGMPQSTGAADKVGDIVAMIADIQREISELEFFRDAALNRLSREIFQENCLYMRLVLHYSWAKIAVKTGGINSPDNIRMMCKNYEW